MSAAVRSATSIRKGAPDLAKCASRSTSSVAPRLSLLDTKIVSTPASTSLESMPDPSSEG